jgi:uncharacterized repeat protein (TIGR01451 family)
MAADALMAPSQAPRATPGHARAFFPARARRRPQAAFLPGGPARGVRRNNWNAACPPGGHPDPGEVRPNELLTTRRPAFGIHPGRLPVRRAVFLSTLVVGLITSLAAVAADPVTGTIEARKVVVGEKGEELFVPADEVRPQDVIEYRLTYANHGAGAVRNISITDPVPAGVQYVAKTAKNAKSHRVEFSVDSGKTFHAWPVKVTKKTADGKEVTVDAAPEMITHIRWTLSSELAPEDEITFSYRAKVK